METMAMAKKTAELTAAFTAVQCDDGWYVEWVFVEVDTRERKVIRHIPGEHSTAVKRTREEAVASAIGLASCKQHMWLPDMPNNDE